MAKFGNKNEDPLKRIGLFGGTFNPVHLGHLWAADAVLNTFGLDGIIFIPAAVPPHKSPEGVEPALDRADMLRLALAHTPFTMSDVELKRAGPSYTIDTVRHFQKAGAKDDVFFLMVGLDAFVEMDTWWAYLDLFSTIPMLVMSRPFATADVHEKIRSLVDRFLIAKVSTEYQFSEKENSFFHPSMKPIHLFCHHMLDISATDIRAKIGQGKPLDTLVPAPVKDYIIEKGLYR